MARYSGPVHKNRDILSIKFEGEALKYRSLPIYELASSLIAIQRIIHKAALFSEGKLENDVHLPTRRREELAAGGPDANWKDDSGCPTLVFGGWVLGFSFFLSFRNDINSNQPRFTLCVE